MFTDEEIIHIGLVKKTIQNKLYSIADCRWCSSGHQWNKVYLSGGAIASIIQGEEPKDWDFYFEDLIAMEDFTHDIMTNHLQEVKDVDPKYTDCLGKDGKMITSKAITMKDGSSFITMIAMEPAEVKKTFDYKHCLAHYSIKDGLLHISPETYRAAKDKKLIVNNSNAIKPWREHKFLSRGYSKP